MTQMVTPRDDRLDVTVVMPTYNRSRYVVRALDSVRHQARWPACVMVVDDASTDDTVEVVRRWGEQYRFPVTIERMATNGGPARARNRGIALATTRYIAFLDSDDEHVSDTLARLTRLLDADDGIVVSFGDATLVTPDQRTPHAMFAPHVDLARDAMPFPRAGANAFRLADPSSLLLRSSILPTSATCLRRDAALATGGSPENARAHSDWLFWLRMASRGLFVFETDDLALHHRHEENLTHPKMAAFMAREKLRGFSGLLDGSFGVPLTAEQRLSLETLRTEQIVRWRYQLSRLGLREYLAGLSTLPSAATSGSPLQHLVRDPKSVLRAVLHSFR